MHLPMFAWTEVFMDVAVSFSFPLFIKVGEKHERIIKRLAFAHRRENFPVPFFARLRPSHKLIITIRGYVTICLPSRKSERRAHSDRCIGSGIISITLINLCLWFVNGTTYLALTYLALQDTKNVTKLHRLFSERVSRAKIIFIYTMYEFS